MGMTKTVIFCCWLFSDGKTFSIFSFFNLKYADYDDDDDSNLATYVSEKRSSNFGPAYTSVGFGWYGEREQHARIIQWKLVGAASGRNELLKQLRTKQNKDFTLLWFQFVISLAIKFN